MIIDKLNNRTRKLLGYKSLNQVFLSNLTRYLVLNG